MGEEDLAREVAQLAVRSQSAEVLGLVHSFCVQGLRKQPLLNRGCAGDTCRLSAEELESERTCGRLCDGRLAIETTVPTDSDRTDPGQP